jgi:sugar/nucleoside kinase (ribokinase family)
MSILVVGSVAYDSVRTSAGSRHEALGGSATYFSVAASFLAPVSVVAVVGDDFRAEHRGLLERRGVDVSGLETRPGRTFRWAGEYAAGDVNSRVTLDTQLNVFADFSPKLHNAHRASPYLFLANIAPGLQMDVLGQLAERPRVVALDTMDFWIESERSDLARAIEKVDILFMDEGEVRSFAGESNTLKAARAVIDLGPGTVVVKRGEHGVLLFGREWAFAAPAFPLGRVVDPTGAGDSFAGGFMGYLCATGDASQAGLRRAAVVGSVMGSFAVESFSADRLVALDRTAVTRRIDALADLASFAPIGTDGSFPWRDGPSAQQIRRPGGDL